MPTPSVFESDIFQLESLTAAINNVPYQPRTISGMGLFEEQGVSTLNVWVEEEDGVLYLLDVKSRNSDGTVIEGTKRNGYEFRVPHIPSQATIMADEVQGIRTFGSETESQMIESIVNQRLSVMRNSMDYTMESHRLLAIKGLFKNANNVDEDLHTKFGVTQQTHAMVLGTDTTKVRTKIDEVLEKIEDGLAGLDFSGVTVLCGKEFFRKLMDHPKVTETYLNYQAAADLRGDTRVQFNFGGVTWVRYRGTSAVQVADAEAYAIPMGVQGMFLTRFAPANYMETVNTMGLPYYSKSEAISLDKGVRLEGQTNPLNINTRPAAVVKLTTN